MATRTATGRKAPPGISLTLAEYLSRPGVHFSVLRQMRQSPLHYLHHHHTQEDCQPETPAMLLGRATHTAVFEPLRFQIDYAIWQGDRRGKAYEEFLEACSAQGRSVLRENDYNTALAIRDSVRGVPEVATLLEKGFPETSLFWVNAATGLACKARLDFITASGDILDLKTTGSVDPRVFAAHAWRMGYYHQAALYQEAFAVTEGTGLPRCGLIAVEKDPPHACRLFWLDPDSLDAARDEYRGWLARVKDCMTTGKWPGPEPVALELTAPDWAVTGSEAVDFDGVEE